MDIEMVQQPQPESDTERPDPTSDVEREALPSDEDVGRESVERPEQGQQAGDGTEQLLVAPLIE